MYPNRLRTHTRSTRDARRLLGLVCLAVFSLVGCGDTDATSTETQGAESTPELSDEVVRGYVRDLVTAVTPLPSSATKTAQSEWFPKRRDMLRRMRATGPELGRAAFLEYQQRVADGDLLEIQEGLLDVAAHADPEGTVDHLVELIVTYGPALGLRRTATKLLPKIDARRADEVLRPIVSKASRGRTYPPDDVMLAAWVEAMHELKEDSVPVLADIALEYKQSQEARHQATVALGQLGPADDAAQAKNALKTLLIESSGNNYLRRKAAQSMRAIMEVPEFCSVLQSAFENEADPNFGVFLDDMIETVCR